MAHPHGLTMVAAMNLENLLWGLGILALPLLLAIPARVLYQTLILGIGPAERSYRSTVKRILDAGNQVEHFREALNDESRRLGIKLSRARLNETDMLNPLSVTHFLLTPMILILPFVAILSLPIILIGIPIIYGLEILLIRQKVLITLIKSLEQYYGKQVIHIPAPGYGHCAEEGRLFDTSSIVVHFHRVPRVVFLGLFTWLIIHWIMQLEEWWIELLIAGPVYLLLLGLIGIITTALEADLVLVDPSKGRIIPISNWVEGMLKPIVGVGLLFLLGRDLMLEARLDDGNPVLFALVVLGVLYCATGVGVSFQWGYAWWRGKDIRSVFEKQAIDVLSPQSYDLTRSRGRIQLNVRCTMAERIESTIGPKKELNFKDLEAMPSAHESVLTQPSNPLK
jgi:hypothetical protein